MDKLRRITDLFVEGTELHLGDDENGPVLLWVNKLNPFQAQEAVRDGQARRFMAMANLRESGEYDGFKTELSMMSDEQLAAACVDANADEIALDAINDLDLDTELREQREMAERIEALADDAGTAEDSPVRDQANDAGLNWLGQFTKLQAEKREEALAEARRMSRRELEEKFTDRWRFLRTMDVFQTEQQTTEVYYALRDCKGTATGVATKPWDHSACDHTKRWLSSRAQVHELPDALIAQVIAKLRDITVPTRAAGNSGAPASSSESSGPSSTPEEALNPSSPAETPSASPAI